MPVAQQMKYSTSRDAASSKIPPSSVSPTTRATVLLQRPPVTPMSSSPVLIPLPALRRSVMTSDTVKLTKEKPRLAMRTTFAQSSSRLILPLASEDELLLRRVSVSSSSSCASSVEASSAAPMLVSTSTRTLAELCKRRRCVTPEDAGALSPSFLRRRRRLQEVMPPLSCSGDEWCCGREDDDKVKKRRHHQHRLQTLLKTKKQSSSRFYSGDVCSSKKKKRSRAAIENDPVVKPRRKVARLGGVDDDGCPKKSSSSSSPQSPSRRKCKHHGCRGRLIKLGREYCVLHDNKKIAGACLCDRKEIEDAAPTTGVVVRSWTCGSLEGCKKPIHSRGMCKDHARQNSPNRKTNRVYPAKNASDAIRRVLSGLSVRRVCPVFGEVDGDDCSYQLD